MSREEALLWMRGLLDHLDHCHDQWCEAEGETANYLLESVERDLNEMGRLCQTLRRDQHAIAHVN